MSKEETSNDIAYAHKGYASTENSQAKDCPNFLKALGKDDEKVCGKCFYGHIIDNRLVCSNPQHSL